MGTFQIDFGESRASKIAGIDLGTTNSMIAYMDLTGPRIVEDAEGRKIVPSVVSLSEDGRLIAGEPACELLLTRPERTVYSAKRLMGRGVSDIQEELKLFPFRVVSDNQDRESVIQLRLGDRTFTPPEISAAVLRQLKDNAEAALGAPVTQAVITVPAYFNDAQRQATKDAGRLAGLEVLRLVNEPTAASLAYGLHRRPEGRIAVYDLGGGTFDISILKVKDGIFELLSTNGDTHLGGDDMDRRLAESLLSEIETRHGSRFPANIEFQERVRVAAEETKRRLTGAETTAVIIPLPAGGEF